MNFVKSFPVSGATQISNMQKLGLNPTRIDQIIYVFLIMRGMVDFMLFFMVTCSWGYDSKSGMLPLILHVDGAEFYSNSEYLVWSMSSVLSDSHVWDSKFPICILPHDSMGTHATKKHVHETVANLVAWSLRHAASGIGPDRGFRNEPLTGVRKQMAGKPLALGWKGCYFGFRFDEKARKEVNFFYRSYQHGLVCMRCMAQRMHKNWIPELPYKNMDENAAHRMTTVSLLLSCC